MKILAIENQRFGAVISGVNCADISHALATTLREALLKHQLLVFRGQSHLLPEQEVGFYLALDRDAGSIWRDQTNNPWEVFKVEQGNTAGTYQLPDVPGVLVLGKGKVNHHGLQVTLGGDRGAYGKESGSQVLGGGALQWHIDGTFHGLEPCNFTQMRCVEAPAGSGHWVDYDDGTDARLWCEAGSTAFASGRTAFDCLGNEEQQRVLDTRVHYMANPFQSTYQLGNNANGLRVLDPAAEALYERGQELPRVAIEDPAARVHPLVWTCRQTGGRALMPHPRCVDHLEISGRRLGLTQSRLLVEKWMRPAIDPQRVYVHAWQTGDLVIWNNRSMWHSATGRLARDDRRIQHLTACNGLTAPA